jgi:hypothetical protein
MKITVEFDNWDEMEAFRTSGKKTRGRKDDINEAPTVEEVTEKVAQMNALASAPPQQQPLPQQFVQPGPPPGGFPGGNGQVPVHPLVTAIIARIDGAISTGQSTDAIATWFRQQIGPEAANATLDQIKQIFVPKMSSVQLETLAPILGIKAQ